MANRPHGHQPLPAPEHNHRHFKVFAAVMLGLQAAAIVCAAWFIAYDQAAGGFSSMEGLLVFPLVLIGFPLLGIVGFVPALLFLRKQTVPAVVLMSTSLAMGTLVVPSYIARGLSPLFSAAARGRLDESRTEGSQAYSETKRTHYAVLSEAFQRPQKIVEAQYEYLLLEDGNVLELFGLDLTRDTEADFTDFAREKLVGKMIKIDLPDYSEFAKSYIPGMRTGIFANPSIKWPRDPKRNEPYGVIPVLIHVDGALINSRKGKRATCAEISGTCADAFSGYASGRSTRSFSSRGSARSDRLLAAATVRARWAGGPRVFATPDEAARVLIDAVKTSVLNATVEANDVKPLVALFGSPSRADDLVRTGGWAEAQRNRELFVAAAAEAWRWEDVGPNRKELVLGNEAWPFPVPLVKGTAGWSFDPEAGREEVMNRQIGRNELATIRHLQDYVAAQMAYAATGHDGKPAGRYARGLGSAWGKQNGLYWPRRPGEPRSPLGFLFARAEGDGRNGPPSSFQGYLFRILEGQGSSAKGGAANYVVGGEMTGGFALVAWPSQHPVGQRNVLSGSGVMTFVVNQDGVVYEKELGPETTAAVRKVTLYDPDGSWRPVQAVAKP